MILSSTLTINCVFSHWMDRAARQKIRNPGRPKTSSPPIQGNTMEKKQDTTTDHKKVDPKVTEEDKATSEQPEPSSPNAKTEGSAAPPEPNE